ncbi:MFS transporter [Streptomyces buecherae]|uniref:MFS transporter n=1 Tax=Streptomyces buecherae TaxID=2763006 RepID=UPI001C2722A7|nr:MFS transporter [Streptomyces buecherae]
MTAGRGWDAPGARRKAGAERGGAYGEAVAGPYEASGSGPAVGGGPGGADKGTVDGGPGSAPGTGGAVRGRRWVLVAVALAVCCVQLDAFALNLALPQIAADLAPAPAPAASPDASGGPDSAGGAGSGGAGGVRWVVSGYLLAAGSLMVGAGRFGDLWGRRRMLLLGLALFGAASAACALAPGLPALVAARVVQGAGGACLMPAGLALLTGAYPPALRGRATGWALGLGGVATACGPFVGGALTQALSWRAVCWLNVPLVCCAALAAWAAERPARSRCAGRSPRAGWGARSARGGWRARRRGSAGVRERGRARRWDWPGLVAGTAALAALGLFVDRGPAWGWWSGASAATLGACGAALAGFVRRQRRAPEPLVDLSLFRNGPYVALTGSGAVANAATVVFLYVTPLALQGTWTLSAGEAGCAFLAPATAMAGAGVVAGRVAPSRAVAVMAGCLVAGAVGLGAMAGAGTLPRYLCAATAAGAALGLANALTLAATQAVIDPRRAGEASGVTKTVVTVAAGLGVALVGPTADGPADTGAGAGAGAGAESGAGAWAGQAAGAVDGALWVAALACVATAAALAGWLRALSTRDA